VDVGNVTTAVRTRYQRNEGTDSMFDLKSSVLDASYYYCGTFLAR
jgi:hypothetical protein